MSDTVIIYAEEETENGWQLINTDTPFLEIGSQKYMGILGCHTYYDNLFPKGRGLPQEISPQLEKAIIQFERERTLPTPIVEDLNDIDRDKFDFNWTGLDEILNADWEKEAYQGDERTWSYLELAAEINFMEKIEPLKKLASPQKIRLVYWRY